MKRTKYPLLRRTTVAKKPKFPKPSMPFRTSVKRDWKLLTHDSKFPPWGAYPCHIMKKIPATYFINLYKDGWACGPVKEYIETHWKELKKRKKKERESGRDKKYKKKHYQQPLEYYNKPRKS
ncbi:MAG: hypothetical protein KAS04_00165 [Candidatus Aenigmarchaeota archaeon]|nr:hypothetical protein [Candidatus Aenigmarchaeota archaeon]